MFLCRINKNYPKLSPNTPAYLELCWWLYFDMFQVKVLLDLIMDSSDSDLSDCDCEELQDHTKLPRPPDGDVKEGKFLLKKGPVLAPNHEDLIRAGSSLGSISLPPKHLQLSPNHQELVWMGSSLGTMHKFLPKPKKKKDSIDSFKGSQISGIQRIPSNLSRSKLSSCRFGSQTVSESGTDNYSFCRICQMQGDDRDPLFSPCRCSGSLRYVHGSCLKVRITAVDWSVDCIYCMWKGSLVISAQNKESNRDNFPSEL